VRAYDPYHPSLATHQKPNQSFIFLQSHDAHWQGSIILHVTTSTTVLLELPVPVVEWTDLARLQPPRNAVEVESMLYDVTVSCGLFRRGCGGVRVSRTLHIPQATVHSSLVADDWLAWHSMPVEIQG
jgi:hypothetical protein